MDERLRTSILRSIPALATEWPTSFEPWGATCAALAALRVPIALIRGSNTTAAARGVVDILHELWPDAPMIEIPNAGHNSPITHADHVNSGLERLLDKHSSPAL
jgi:pimeloyl-ACP methyl ester carboxylesterase